MSPAAIALVVIGLAAIGTGVYIAVRPAAATVERTAREAAGNGPALDAIGTTPPPVPSPIVAAPIEYYTLPLEQYGPPAPRSGSRTNSTGQRFIGGADILQGLV